MSEIESGRVVARRPTESLQEFAARRRKAELLHAVDSAQCIDDLKVVLKQLIQETQ